MLLTHYYMQLLTALLYVHCVFTAYTLQSLVHAQTAFMAPEHNKS